MSIQFTYDFHAIQKNVQQYAVSDAQSTSLSTVGIKYSNNLDNTYNDAQLTDLTCLWRRTSSKYENARFSIKDRVALYVSAIQNSLSSYKDLTVNMSEFFSNDAQFILASFNDTIKFNLSPQSILYGNVVHGDGKAFKYRDEYGNEREYSCGHITDQDKVSRFLTTYFNKITQQSSTIVSKNSGYYMWYKIAYSYDNSPTSPKIGIGNIFNIEQHIKKYLDVDFSISTVDADQLGGHFIPDIAYTFELAIRLYNFYVALQNVKTIYINIEYMLQYIGTKENVLITNTIDAENSVKSPYKYWNNAATIQLLNNSEYTISFSPYSIVYFPTKQLNYRRFESNRKDTDTNSYTITNLFNVVNGNFANIDRNFQNSAEGSNGVLSYFINVADAQKINTFQEFADIYLTSIFEHEISLSKILLAIDQIFFDWLNNIHTINITMKICHQNCHTNMYTSTATVWECTCSGWQTTTTGTTNSFQIPSSNISKNEDTESDDQGL